MKLQLHPHATPQGPAKAAFLRGKDPALWLQQLQAWGIPVQNLEAYPVPYSIRDRAIAGLLVVLKQGNFPETKELLETYRCVGSALLIPQCSTLSPQIAESEWPKILHYHWHFYHPGIGMVGFQRSDQVRLSDLLQYPAPQSKRWNLAQKGPDPTPNLQSISVQMPKIEEIFAQVQGVGEQSPEELLKKRPNSGESEDAHIQLLNKLEQLLQQRGQLREGETQGILGKWLDKLQLRIQQKLHDLQKKRDDEISRLLKLFEENPDEALRYSIPLNTPYQGRGIASPGSPLGRRDPLDFNLGKLSATSPRDNWDIDQQRRMALQQFYLQQANQKIAEGDYRKAAYIHAHLLGDFNTAANVLMQGKHHHEAALLYRDHLKNPQQAAYCFEQGGLYSEAIPIYLELGEEEKAGDLYALLDQADEAEKLYQTCVQKALDRKDFLGAARLYDAKLKDVPQAKIALIRGWHQAHSPVSCLNAYFDYFKQGSTAELDAEIQRIHQQEVSAIQQDAFMQVLKTLGSMRQHKGKLPLAREIVYRVVSQELLTKRLDHLEMLNTFVPGDRLLEGDSSRFKAALKEKFRVTVHTDSNAPIRLVKSIELPKEVDHWLEARMQNQHLLALGKQKNDVYLLCSDLKSTNECVRAGQAQTKYHPQILALPYSSAYLNFFQTDTMSMDAIRLIETYFGKETLKYNLRPQENILAYVPLSPEQIAKLELQQDHSLMLHICSPKGEIKKSFLCQTEKGITSYISIPPTYSNSFVAYNGGYIYFAPYKGNTLLRIDLEGNTSTILHSGVIQIMHMAISDSNSRPRLAVHFKDPDNNLGFSCKYYKIENDKLISSGSRFEPQQIVTNLLFIHEGLVITLHDQLHFYTLEDDQTPTIVYRVQVKDGISLVFKGPMRNQIGILTSSGKVLFYEIDDLDP